MLWPGYVLAAALLLLCAAAAGWFLFADRARGRRRCPRCFYAMEGVSGLTCPECGRTARSEQALFRTRRRWKGAILAVVILLPPALAAAGLTRIRQTGGWSDLPDWAVTRLLWLGDDSLRDDVIRRIHLGRLGRDEAAHIVLVACDWLESSSVETRDHGFELLDGLAYNSYIIEGDRPGARRPMLEELRPDRSEPIIIALAEAGDERAIKLLSHLRDVNAAAAVALVSSGTSTTGIDALMSQWRASRTVERLPNLPHALVSEVQFRRGPGMVAGRHAIQEFAAEVAARRDDREGLAQWAHTQAESEEATSYRRALSLWLWCRLDGFGEASRRSVRSALSSSDPVLQSAAVGQLAGFGWSAETETALREALASDMSSTVVEAFGVMKHYGRAAAPLLPDLLACARRDKQVGGGNQVDLFRRLGGDPPLLLDAIVDRLTHILATQRPSEPPGKYPGPARPLGNWDVAGSLWALSDLRLRDDRAAAVVREIAEIAPAVADSMVAWVAYAVLTGDRTLATRSVLEHDPDLNERMSIPSPQETILRLIREDLDDQQLIVEYYVESDDPQRRLGFAKLMGGHEPRAAIERYRAALERLAADADPAIAAAAQKALDKIN